LFNGQTGYVRDIEYQTLNPRPGELPVAVIVEFPSIYTGPSFYPDWTNVVPN